MRLMVLVNVRSRVWSLVVFLVFRNITRSPPPPYQELTQIYGGLSDSDQAPEHHGKFVLGRWM